MREPVDLGIAGLGPLGFLVEEPERWRRVYERLHATAFLRSEGTVVTVGPPQRAEEGFAGRCRELVERFDRFFAAAGRAYFDSPELCGEFLFNPLLEPLLEIDSGAVPITPLARLDCVLGQDGSLRVIEINPVGVCLYHLRSVLYLVRRLRRAGLTESAAELDSVAAAAVAAFDRYYRLRAERPRPRPTLGALTPPRWIRASQLLFRDAFRRAGWDYVYGDAGALEVARDGIRLAGQFVDLLWPDFLFYMAYQEARYRHTHFPSALGDLGAAPAQAAAILADRGFLDHLRSRRTVHVSPATSYLVLSKSLLAWIHDPERPVPEADREWLGAHVARTFGARERRGGLLSRERAAAEREGLLIKPCQVGGSHGVRLGRDLGDDEWARALDAMWEDESWVVQEFWPPARASDGRFLSLGLSSFGGELGGIALRAAATRTVSARDSAFIPVVIGAGRTDQ